MMRRVPEESDEEIDEISEEELAAAATENEELKGI